MLGGGVSGCLVELHCVQAQKVVEQLYIERAGVERGCWVRELRESVDRMYR